MDNGDPSAFAKVQGLHKFNLRRKLNWPTHLHCDRRARVKGGALWPLPPSAHFGAPLLNYHYPLCGVPSVTPQQFARKTL